MPGGNPIQPVRTDPPTVRSIDSTTLALKLNEGLPRQESYEFGGRRKFYNEPQRQNDWATEVEADSPIGWWRLEEEDGTTLEDAIGGRDATLSGGYTLAQPGALKDGLGLAFGGVDGRAATAEAAAFRLGVADFSMELWLRYRQRSFATVYAIRNTTGNTNIQGILMVGRVAAGDIAFETWAWTAAHRRCRTARPKNDNRWHHVVGTYTAADDTARLYVDAQLVDARVQDAVAIGVSGDFSVTLGSNASPIQYYKGLMDEAVYYDQALSLERITQHYLSERQ
jgi:hypothetical protein